MFPAGAFIAMQAITINNIKAQQEEEERKKKEKEEKEEKNIK